MVKLALQLKAVLEHTTALLPAASDFRWYVKSQCSSCNEEGDTFMYITGDEEVEMPGGKGTANVVVKCKLCARQYSISIMEQSVLPYNYDDSGTFKTIASFECRGGELIAFEPRLGWQCKGYKVITYLENGVFIQI